MNPYIYTGLRSPIKRRFLISKIENHKNNEIDRLLESICSTLNISVIDLKSESRERPLPDSRKIVCKVMYRDKTPLSLKRIGELLNRDHSTVLYNIRTCNNLIETDTEFAEKYKRVIESL